MKAADFVLLLILCTISLILFLNRASDLSLNKRVSALEADLTVDSSDLTGDLVWSEYNYEVLMTLGENKMTIGDPPIAVINLTTGQVELLGDPNQAARIFWDAVELEK